MLRASHRPLRALTQNALASALKSSSRAASGHVGRKSFAGAALSRAKPSNAAMGSVTILPLARATVRFLSNVTTRPNNGAPGSKDWALFFHDKDKTLSPWHDVALHPKKGSKHVVTFINEIPKGTRAKMEVATKEAHNPIKQDIKKGELRFFKYGAIPFNYGMIPQTWENPNAKNADTGLVGDNDPLDVVEFSSQPLPIGSVSEVKVLGLLALIDEGETDWKILAVSTKHPLAHQLEDLADLEKLLPGAVDSAREWFRMYKTADGKPQNKFAFDEKARDKQYALGVIDECSHSYKDLLAGKIPAGKLALPKKA